MSIQEDGTLVGRQSLARGTGFSLASGPSSLEREGLAGAELFMITHGTHSTPYLFLNYSYVNFFLAVLVIYSFIIVSGDLVI